jgi:glycosyltransferase involved in cell wall biosynthesis
MSRSVCHVITGLDMGGAEMMLYKLLTHGAVGGRCATVVSLLPGGAVGDRLRAAGIDVRVLGMSRRPSWKGLRALAQILRDARPAIVQGWMYHGNLAALAGATMARLRGPVLWSIRQSVYRLRDNPWPTAGVIKTGALLSRRPRAIIYNSNTAARQHHELGYASRCAHVIPNGFDLTQFMRSPESRQRVRRELHIANDAPLVAAMGRYDPVKDFPTFLDAARIVAAQLPHVRFCIAGPSTSGAISDLRALIADRNLSEHVRLPGMVSDSPSLMSAADVFCLSSAWAEGFPNVLGEAMSAETVCVTTDVGDAAYVVGETGFVVQPRDPSALAQAVIGVLQLDEDKRRRLGAAARQRVEQHFSLPQVASRYDAVYGSV